ncbi:MAG: flagellin lysine-N-methylase [Ruminococcus sp.]|nr:flagellin lysine-N-methylase [Ruminococcus sp.]
MKNIYPSYYENFKCIANRCPDSCCQGWDVVVDDKSHSFYNSINGEFGDKIREVTAIDEDGDRIFLLKNGRCPFWNKDELCDIFINLGEEHLCKTCKKFPRITMDYDCFTEHTLSLACPEAARLILSEGFTILSEFEDLDFSSAEYNGGVMEFLLKARAKSAEILSNKILPFNENLQNCLRFNRKIQDKLSPISKNQINKAKDFSFIFKIHERLEFINAEYSEKIKNASGLLPNKDFDEEFRRLALYYIYRYYLNAVENFDILSTLRKIVCAYIIIGALANAEGKPDIIKIIQNYSKEVEHSYDNMAVLEFFFDNDDGFDVDNLIDLLRF